VLSQIAWRGTQQVGCVRVPDCYERTPGWARTLFVCEYQPQAVSAARCRTPFPFLFPLP